MDPPDMNNGRRGGRLRALLLVRVPWTKSRTSRDPRPPLPVLGRVSRREFLGGLVHLYELAARDRDHGFLCPSLLAQHDDRRHDEEGTVTARAVARY